MRHFTHSIILIVGIIIVKCANGDRRAMYDHNGEFLAHVRLAKDLVEQYDNRVRPVLNHSQPTQVKFMMSLYQILAINEKEQSVDLNLWIIQKWHDEFLGWNPKKYGGINDTILPHQKIWLPDTYLYNSMVMNREESERYINVVISTDHWKGTRGAQVMFMYPALYRVSCRINILYFPYDQQNCTLVISSWTSDMTSIDYQPDASSVNLHSFIRNEEWEVVSFRIQRVVQRFVCCPEPWVLLHASLVVRRKPLYYIVNLVLPTSVITLVAVTGFFTPASTSTERREKLSLGIDSLLAMSILMMMVSEQMPTTSDYVPLFGIFYLSIIMIIFTGTLITAFVLNVHLQKMYNKPIPPLVSYIFFHKISPLLGIRPPTILLELWQDTGVYIEGLSDKMKNRRKDSRKRVGRFNSDDGGRSGRRRAGGRSMPASMKEQPIPLEKKHHHHQMRMINSHSLLTVNHQQQLNSISSNSSGISANHPVRRGGSCVERIKHRIWRLSPSIEEREREEEEHELSAAEEEEHGDETIEEIGETQFINSSNNKLAGGGHCPTNPRSGLTRDQSIRARNNWRRIAQKANAKHRDALERGESMQSIVVVADKDVCGGIAPFDEIPFVDLSPGRLTGSLAPTARQQQSQFHPQQQQQSNIPASTTLPTYLSPRLMVPAPIPINTFPASGSSIYRHHSAKDLSAAPSKRPPPIPATAAKQSPALINNTDSVPAALQLFLMPGNSQKDPKVNAATVLDLKLRRRFAYEWEFLATVLDRLLLIVFAGLVLFVTGAMIGFGEIILRSYTNSTEEEQEDIPNRSHT